MLDDTQDRRRNIQQQAGWAQGSTARVIAEILGQAAEPKVMERLRFKTKPISNEDMTIQKQDATLFVTLLSNMASTRSWSMAYLTETQPHNWLGLLHSDLTLVKQSLEKIRRDAELVKTAHRRMLEQDETVDLEALCLRKRMYIYVNIQMHTNTHIHVFTYTLSLTYTYNLYTDCFACTFSGKNYPNMPSVIEYCKGREERTHRLISYRCYSFARVSHC